MFMSNFIVAWFRDFIDFIGHDTQKKLISLRRLVNQLYFRDGLSKKAIAEQLRVGKHFVIRWTQSMDQDVTIDHRGWPKGHRRRWPQETEDRIALLHKELKGGTEAFYWGPTAIAQEWLNRYPAEQPPPLRTIGQILKDLGLSEPRARKVRRGASRYLCYPEHTIYETLGHRVMEADFIGKKYITGTQQPIHFLAFSFKKPPKLRHYQRIEAQSADCFIEQCERFFATFEKPDCIKVDNAAATIGSGSGKRTISRTVQFLLANQVIPIFAVPRKPFSQASIEGNNSVFARKFWNRRTFSSLEQIDTTLVAFNKASRNYTGYQPPVPKANSEQTFVPKVYFLRQVRQTPEGTDGFIDVLNESVCLPKSYINYFVLAEWNLSTELLSVYLENDKELEEIKNSPFPINPRSKRKLKKEGGARLFCH
jgi:transposase